jgi:hypothetical protein
VIDCAGIDRKFVPAGLFDAPRNAVSVQWPQGFERLERHQCERALPDIGFLIHRIRLLIGEPSYGEGIGRITQLVWERNSKIQIAGLQV